MNDFSVVHHDFNKVTDFLVMCGLPYEVYRDGEMTYLLSDFDEYVKETNFFVEGYDAVTIGFIFKNFKMVEGLIQSHVVIRNEKLARVWDDIHKAADRLKGTPNHFSYPGRRERLK